MKKKLSLLLCAALTAVSYTHLCVRLGMYSSDVLKKVDTLDILRLMDDIRASWGLVFDCEK